MPQPYIGEIRMFAGNYAPQDWMFCGGQTVPIDENEALFNLIGTTYGGDGEQTFGLPDLRGRIPIHSGSGHRLGQSGGVEEVTLTSQQMPIHAHALLPTTDSGTSTTPAGAVPAASGSTNLYRTSAAGSPLASQTVGPAGGSQPHSNLQPYLCMNFIISMFGIYPSPS